VRDILTMRLRPSLASQAPNVSMIILKDGIGTDKLYKIIGIRRTILSIIPSRHRRDIRK